MTRSFQRVSPAKRGGYFSYLTSAAGSTQTKPPAQEESGQENNYASVVGRDEPRQKPCLRAKISGKLSKSFSEYLER
jgi:hypothetical protein